MIDDAIDAASRSELLETIAELEAEVKRLRAERDAAREEVERLREALSALATDEMESVVVANDNARRWKALMMKQSVYTGMALDERDAAREAARAWKRVAKLWRRIAIDHIGEHFARWLFGVRKESRP